MKTSTLNIVDQTSGSESEQALLQVGAVELTDADLEIATGAWGGCGGNNNYDYGNFYGGNYGYSNWGGWGGHSHGFGGHHHGFGHGGHGHGGHSHGGHH